MIKLEFDIEASAEEAQRYHEIFSALIKCGGLTGVRGGSTNIHFNGEGDFMGIQLSYWPWKRRKQPDGQA